MNELQGCKSESWLNCLLSWTEAASFCSLASVLFNAVCPRRRRVATMFFDVVADGGRGGRSDGGERKRSREEGIEERKMVGSADAKRDREIGNFYYRFVSILRRNHTTKAVSIHRAP